jgi:hypothetical protein
MDQGRRVRWREDDHPVHPGTTMRNDRARKDLDRHPSYILACSAKNLCHLAGCSADDWLLGPAPPVRAWDDRRLVGLKHHSRYDLALAPGHRLPPLGAIVAPEPVRLPATHRNVRSVVLQAGP